ncbi:MAG: response regulator transcription factor [Verrucomicrobia bacterium]|nr:MAG: response regulator transcription factor [Verrucomicrobiota bacterium]
MNATQPAAIRLWVVEDNATYQDALAFSFKTSGSIELTRQFFNAEDARAALRAGPPPDAILLDVQLPGLDGISAISLFKAAAPAVCIVILTVFEDHRKVFRALCAGASGYLLKTAPAERIAAAIADAVAGGAPMSPSVARAVLGRFVELAAPGRNTYDLSARERDVLELMTQGLVKKEIADRLTLSPHTVNSHLKNIYVKLHVGTRGAAVAKALKERLV